MGFSGGPDSTALLHALKTLRPKADLAAIHVHHGLRKEADQWREHCLAFCASLAIPCLVEHVTLAGQANLEARARTARYAAFRRRLPAEAILLLAHHRGDQAETVLFRVLRGHGMRGLSGIPAARASATWLLLRPWLQHPREDLCAYLKVHGLTGIHDPGNDDPRFDRNFLRAQILPLLEARFPGLEQRLQRLSEHAALADRVLSEKLDSLLTELGQGGRLDLSGWRRLPEDLRVALLRHWLAASGDQACERALREFARQLNKPGATAEFKGQAHIFHSWRDLLFATPVDVIAGLDETPLAALDWPSAAASLSLPDGRTLTLSPAQQARLAGCALRVSARSGGESWRDPRGGPALSLKNLLQEAQVPPLLRQHLLLLSVRASAADDWRVHGYWVPGEPCLHEIRRLS